MASTECIGTDGYGLEYVELACEYKWLGAITSKYEMYYDHEPLREWMKENTHIPVITVIIYGLLIVLGTKMMENRKPWGLKTSLALWNLGLAVYSLTGFVKMAPFMYYLIKNRSFRSLFCNCIVQYNGAGSTGLWGHLFVFSKFPELIDTFFIVVNKKKLMFLHWYHHMTVLLYCWYSYVVVSPGGGFYTVMNYGVHGIMYSYYFLMSIKMKPKWFNPLIITMTQIAQMFVGVTVNAINYYYYKTGDTSEGACPFNTAACVMYASYLLLFLQFFGNRYKVKSNKASKKNV